MEILKDVLSFVESNYLWFLGGLLVLVLFLFIMLLVSISNVKREKKNCAALLAKHASENDSAKTEIESLKDAVAAKEKGLILKENTILEKNQIISELSANIENISNDLECAKAREASLSENLEAVKVETDAKILDLTDALKSANLTATKSATELKDAKKALVDAENKYLDDLNAVKTTSGELAEEFSKFRIESSETIQKLKEELKNQKDINGALVIALNEIRGKDTTTQPTPNNVLVDSKVEKIENLKREDVIAVAKSIGLEGVYKMKKDDIIEAIKTKLNKEKTSKVKRTKNKE